MNPSRDFLVLSDEWGAHPSSTIHLFRRIAQDHRVFWWNTVNRMPRLSWQDARKVARVLRRWGAASGAEDVAAGAGVRASTPTMVPFFKAPGRAFNRFSLRRAYRSLVATHAVEDPVVVTTFPSTVDFVTDVDATLKVYYCVDEWLDYPGLDVRAGRAMEGKLLASVDAFVGTSRPLMEKARADVPALYLPHGVDVDHFQGEPEGAGVADPLRDLPRPIVGFFGLISEWVDQGVVCDLAEAFPRVSFVLIGKADVDVRALEACPNVHLPGPVPYAELPGHARAFDVGLIPFVTNRLTRAVNPLKLMEYYALGLPVLATRLPELERAEGPIVVATTKQEYRDGLSALLGGSSTEQAKRALEVAANNSWERRVRDFLAFLDGVKEGSA